MPRKEICRYPSGKLWAVTYYNDCQRDGLHRIWYENGRLKLSAFYRDGVLNGPMSRWYSDGKISYHGAYLNGIEHGVIREYDERGELVHEDISLPFDCSEEYANYATLLRQRQLSANEIMMIDNSDLRSICAQEIGYEVFYSQLDRHIIDKGNESELVMVNWHHDEESLYLLKVRCPSTGTYYVLRVPPEFRTVKEAVGWTFGLGRDEFSPQIET